MDELEFRAYLEDYLVKYARKIPQLPIADSLTGVYLEGYNGAGDVRIKASMLNIPAELTVDSVEEITLSVAYGTLRNDVGLPAVVSVRLSNGTARMMAVTFGGYIPSYNENQSGSYLTYGTISLLQGIANPNNIRVIANVTVQAEPVLNITSVETIAPLTVPFGDNAPSLPLSVEVTLSDNSTRSLFVNWGNPSPAYNKNVAGTYSYTGAISVVSGVTNTSNITASIAVIVEEEIIVDLDITSVAPITNITVPFGSNAPTLPTTITVTLDDASTRSLGVVWGSASPTYNKDLAGNYTYSGTPTLVSGVTNTANRKASVIVTVQAEVVDDLNITSIQRSDITAPYASTEGSLTFPTTVTATLSDSSTTSLDVTWGAWVNTFSSYLPITYEREGTVSLPTGITNTSSIKAIANVSVQEEVYAQMTLTPTLTAQPMWFPGVNPSVNATHYPNIAYGNNERHRFDITIPNGGTGPYPLVIYMHGGYFVEGHKDVLYVGNDAFGMPLFNEMLLSNVAVASINYRLMTIDGNDKEGVYKSLTDARYCLQYIKAISSHLNIDKNKIVFAGSSAGANTALWLNYHDDMAQPASPNPILRESTKVQGTCSGRTGASFDDSLYETVIMGNIGFSMADFIANHDPDWGTMRELYVGASNESDRDHRMSQILPKLEFYGMMSADDAPFYADNRGYPYNVLPVTRGELVHHGNCAEVLRVKANTLGIPNVVYHDGFTDSSGMNERGFILDLFGISTGSRTIVSVQTINIEFSVGTELSSIIAQIPTTALVTLDDSTVVSIEPTWSAFVPPYDKDTAGIYSTVGVFETLPAGITNPNEITATANITLTPIASGEKQDFIDLHTPNVGGNLLLNSSFVFANRVGWLSAPELIIEDGVVKFDSALRTEANMLMRQEGIPVVAGKTYTISLRARSENMVPLQAGFLVAARYEPSGTEVYDVTTTNLIMTGTNGWQRLTHTFTVQAGQTSINLSPQLFQVTGGIAWAEEFQLKEESSFSVYGYNTMEELLAVADRKFP